MYYGKYIKYKKKYFDAKQYIRGGLFDINEKTFVANNKDIILDTARLKYIVGPISLTIIFNSKYNKKIYLFGDKHVAASDNIDCASDITNDNAIYLPDYLKYYFDKTKNIPIDLFIELPYQQDKFVPSMQKGMINNTRIQFEPCFKFLTDKYECNKLYPNIRYHSMDIRKYLPHDNKLTNNEKFITDITLILNYIESINRLQTDEDSYDDLIDKAQATTTGVFNDIANDPYITNEYNELLATYYEGDPIVLINNVWNFIKNNTSFNNTSLLNELDFLSHLLSMYLNDVVIPPSIMDIIRKYFGDENGIYSDIDKKFWNGIKSSPKLSKNLNTIVEENFDTNIYLKYKTFPNDFMKEIMSSGIISPLNGAYLHSFIAFMYFNTVMDVYLLGRMFKNFTRIDSKDISAETAENIYVIAGDYHIVRYINFLKKLNSSVILYNEQHNNNTVSSSDRCVMIQPLLEYQYQNN